MAESQIPTETVLPSTPAPQAEVVSKMTTPEPSTTTIPQTNGVLTNGIASEHAPQPTPTSAETKPAPTSIAPSEPTLPAYAAAISDAADQDDTPLFSPSLISDETKATLPTGYTIRPLRRSDYFGGTLPKHYEIPLHYPGGKGTNPW